MNKRKWKPHLKMLQALNSLSSEQKNDILKYMNDEGIDVICECIKNAVYNSEINKDKALISVMKKDKKLYRYLANAKPKILSKRKRIVQTGEGLGVILGTLIPLLSQFLLK